MRGLGVAKACRLAAAFELGRRVEMERAAKNSPVRTASDAARIARNSLSGLQREHLKVLFLNSRNRLLGEETVFVGSLGSNAFCPREIFKAAFDRGAAAVILAHNHPSGDPSPSSEDVEATKKLALAGGLVGVQVLDHLVVGGKKVSSMRQEGLL
jgi:DNA repair protein RadC